MTSSPEDLERRIGRFGGVWAKVEIFLGLAATGAGLMLGDWALTRPPVEIDWGFAAGALVLFVLGGYLTLAGQRSHIYRSNMELEVRLGQKLHLRTPQGERE